MSKIMMMLGAYSFMLDTAPYTTLKRTHAYRWKKSMPPILALPGMVRSCPRD